MGIMLWALNPFNQRPCSYRTRRLLIRNCNWHPEFSSWKRKRSYFISDIDQIDTSTFIYFHQYHWTGLRMRFGDPNRAGYLQWMLESASRQYCERRINVVHRRQLRHRSYYPIPPTVSENWASRRGHDNILSNGVLPLSRWSFISRTITPISSHCRHYWLHGHLIECFSWMSMLMRTRSLWPRTRINATFPRPVHWQPRSMSASYILFRPGGLHRFSLWLVTPSISHRVLVMGSAYVL